MIAPQAQPDSALDKTPKFSWQAEKHYRVLRCPGASPGHLQRTRETKAGSNMWRGFGRETSATGGARPGREQLLARRVIKPAAAVGAWIEQSGQGGRHPPVPQEKRRDGRHSARDRFIAPLVIKGHEMGEFSCFSGEKADHCPGGIADPARALVHTGGALNIIEGEIEIRPLHALGNSRAAAIYGSSSIPCMSRAAPRVRPPQERAQATLAALPAAPEEAVKKSGAAIRKTVAREIGDARNDFTRPEKNTAPSAKGRHAINEMSVTSRHQKDNTGCRLQQQKSL